ncbi:hypothetical protein [Streptomyces sp. NPDC088725]|uniref:hypothetical protein n=1 Tax=Streptomyces sp. NPDC088725 TaxID=3365873 RepID=UPI003829575C
MIALISAVLAGCIGIALPLLCGSLAVTFAVLGLSKPLNRGQCTVGLATGGLGVLHPVFLLATFGG